MTDCRTGYAQHRLDANTRSTLVRKLVRIAPWTPARSLPTPTNQKKEDDQ